jgi:hypothetical protein
MKRRKRLENRLAEKAAAKESSGQPSQGSKVK